MVCTKKKKKKKLSLHFSFKSSFFFFFKMWILVSQFPFSKDNTHPSSTPFCFPRFSPTQKKEKRQKQIYPFSFPSKFKPKASENLKIDQKSLFTHLKLISTKSSVRMCKREQPLRPRVRSNTIPRPKRLLPLPCL